MGHFLKLKDEDQDAEQPELTFSPSALTINIGPPAKCDA